LIAYGNITIEWSQLHSPIKSYFWLLINSLLIWKDSHWQAHVGGIYYAIDDQFGQWSLVSDKFASSLDELDLDEPNSKRNWWDRGEKWLVHEYRWRRIRWPPRHTTSKEYVDDHWSLCWRTAHAMVSGSKCSYGCKVYKKYTKLNTYSHLLYI